MATRVHRGDLIAALEASQQRMEETAASDTIGVREFIISCVRTRVIACHASVSTASSSPTTHCSDSSRCGTSPGTVKEPDHASRFRPSCARTIRRPPAGSARTAAIAAGPKVAMSSRRVISPLASRRAARLAKTMRPPESMTNKAALTASSNARSRSASRAALRSLGAAAKLRSGRTLAITMSAIASSAARPKSSAVTEWPDVAILIAVSVAAAAISRRQPIAVVRS